MPIPKPADVPVLNLFSLKSKSILVTGGSRGIGLAIVQAYAEAGAKVAFTYTSATTTEETAKKVSADTGATVRAYKADTRDRDAVFKLVDAVRSDLGALDVVVVNAGVGQHVNALEQTADEYRKIMSVNVDGAFWTAQAAGKVFRAQGSGNLIFTSSVSGVLVNVPQQQAAYNASKAAVTHLAKSLAVEWADFARVNVVAPGYIATDMTQEESEELKAKWMTLVPTGRFCEPSELKGTYVYLASDASSYVTGLNLIVDGGYTLP